MKDPGQVPLTATKTATYGHCVYVCVWPATERTAAGCVCLYYHNQLHYNYCLSLMYDWLILANLPADELLRRSGRPNQQIN